MSMPVGGDKPCSVLVIVMNLLSDNFTCPCLWVGTSLGSVLVFVMNLLSDNFTCPCLWVGTSLGSVLVIVMNLLSDNFTCPCLWVGTSLGSVLVIVMNLPQAGEQRLTQPVIVSPSGTYYTGRDGRKPVFSVSDKARLKPVSSATETR